MIQDFTVVYPTILQKKLIPIILEGQPRILIKYEDDSGIKAGLFLPFIHKVQSAGAKKKINVVLCHDKKRLEELHEYVESLSKFCQSPPKVKACKKADFLNPTESIDLLLTNPKIFLQLLGSQIRPENLGLLIIDQLEIHLELGFKEELLKAATLLAETGPTRQTIITIKNAEDSDESIQEIKRAFMESALVLRFKQSVSLIEEKLLHYYFNAEGNKENKFLLLFALIKLNVAYGKTLIKASSIDEAYRLKIFLSRFGIASQVLNPETPVNTQKNVLHSFAMGHFDQLILINVPKEFDIKHVRNIIFFNISASYGEYSRLINKASFEDGYILTLLANDAEMTILERIQEKQREHLSGVLFAELPVKKHILKNFEYRVTDALKSVTPKAVKDEKARELKKQLLKSKKLKKYFEEHQHEKDILLKGLSRPTEDYRYSELKNIPSYLMPTESLLANPIEEALNEEKGPAQENEGADLFPNETPELLSYEQLPPTSGRKRWKIRHHRRLKKRPNKRDENFVV